jgi:SAM-dependent methyltransferase
MTDSSEFDSNDAAIDADFYRGGGVSLSETEREILADAAGLNILVTPEGTGEEALSLVNLGATVTVLGQDFERAQMAAGEAGLSVMFVSGDAGESLPDELARGTFDVVYSPWGTFDGLPAFEAWATDVADLLKPGGYLMAFDEHPVSFMVKATAGELIVQTSYWGEFVDEDADGEPDDDEFAPTTFGWAIGDLVTALGNVGLATVRLEEFSEAGRYVSGIELLEGIDEERRSRVPAALLLVARRI